MRGIRTLLLTTMIGAMVLVSPPGAAANGGAYLEFDRTYYVAGDEGHGVTYVSIPSRKAHLLDEGPFYVFVLPRGTALREGSPIPPGAVRLGTVSVIEEDESYELETDFTVPDLAPGWYEIGVCNDPCTISGFRESLGGSLSIVETRREAELLTTNGRLHSRLFGARPGSAAGRAPSGGGGRRARGPARVRERRADRAGRRDRPARNAAGLRSFARSGGGTDAVRSVGRGCDPAGDPGHRGARVPAPADAAGDDGPVAPAASSRDGGTGPLSPLASTPRSALRACAMVEVSREGLRNGQPELGDPTYRQGGKSAPTGG